MESVGLAIGILSLVSLFETCVELADYVTLAHNLGHDYEATYTKYLLVKARLCAWKPCLDILNRADRTEQLSEEAVLISRSLTAIKSLLQNGQDLENRYGLRSHEQPGQQQQQQQQIKLSDAITEIERALTTTIQQRQRRTPWSKKLRWAIHDKKAFDTLISNFAFHVNELEKLATRVQALTSTSTSTSNPVSTSTLIHDSIQTITSPAAVQLLEDATAEPDLESSGACTDGHIFVRNQVAEHARVMFGNIGVDAGLGGRHCYRGNQVIGDARVVMGNLSGEWMAKFFGL